jgi:internalin A
MFRNRITVVLMVFAFAGLAGCEVKVQQGGAPNPPNQPNEQFGGDPGPGAPKEDPAERDLKRLNGKVKRDKNQPDNPVVEIRLFSEKVTDDDLKELTAFTKLRRLEFSAPEVTGTGLSVLAGLPLEELHIMFAKGITDAGLKEIAKIKSLKVLNLPQGKFGDDGVKELAALTNLEELSVSHGVGDVGIYPLKDLKKLRKFSATNCKVGDGAMKTLSELPEMRVLILYGSAVTDLGYGYIGKMQKLEELQTSYNITDKGMAELGNLKNLRKLSVWNSSVTIKGVRALPNLKNLKELEISTWNIKAEEADALRGELPNCNVAYKK